MSGILEPLPDPPLLRKNGPPRSSKLVEAWRTRQECLWHFGRATLYSLHEFGRTILEEERYGWAHAGGHTDNHALPSHNCHGKTEILGDGKSYGSIYSVDGNAKARVQSMRLRRLIYEEDVLMVRFQ